MSSFYIVIIAHFLEIRKEKSGNPSLPLQAFGKVSKEIRAVIPPPRQ